MCSYGGRHNFLSIAERVPSLSPMSALWHLDAAWKVDLSPGLSVPPPG